VCSKELIGYALAPHMRTSLAVDALKAAHRAGLVAGNAIMHTDRGGQYHSRAYRNALRRLEIRQSTSRSGSCLDGAPAESFFATIKTEIGIDSWPDRANARRDIENWIKAYNERRIHSSLGYQTPTEARTSWQHQWQHRSNRCEPTGRLQSLRFQMRPPACTTVFGPSRSFSTSARARRSRRRPGR
jgi:transposase InsO family protein